MFLLTYVDSTHVDAQEDRRQRLLPRSTRVVYLLLVCDIITSLKNILQYHEVYFRVTAPKCPGLAAGAVSLRKSHDIVILSFCDIVKAGSA